MTGQYAHTIDAKGRLFIPAALRKELGQTFHILVDDDVVFLRSLRYHVAHGGEPEAVIRREYPYLSPERVKALALGLSNPDAVPQLCLDDIAAYIRAALPSQEYE